MQCVAWFIEIKSDTQVERKFIMPYGKADPSLPSIKKMVQQLHGDRQCGIEAPCRRQAKSEDTERIRQAF